MRSPNAQRDWSGIADIHSSHSNVPVGRSSIDRNEELQMASGLHVLAQSGTSLYLSFDGTCAEAMRHYEKTLGGKLVALMKHSETPGGMQVSPENADRIMHACLTLPDGAMLMAGDAVCGQPYEGMKGFTLALTYPTVTEAKRAFDALSTGGKVQMPLQKTFWAETFGMLVDRYGAPWAINGAMIQS
jgi:PhnB protein